MFCQPGPERGSGSFLRQGMELRMCWFAVVLRGTKGESFQLSPPPLWLCIGGTGFFFPCKIFSVLMNACMVMVNNMLVVGATEICITVTIIGEAFL